MRLQSDDADGAVPTDVGRSAVRHRRLRLHLRPEPALASAALAPPSPPPPSPPPQPPSPPSRHRAAAAVRQPHHGHADRRVHARAQQRVLQLQRQSEAAPATTCWPRTAGHVRVLSYSAAAPASPPPPSPPPLSPPPLTRRPRCPSCARTQVRWWRGLLGLVSGTAALALPSRTACPSIRRACRRWRQAWATCARERGTIIGDNCRGTCKCCFYNPPSIPAPPSPPRPPPRHRPSASSAAERAATTGTSATSARSVFAILAVVVVPFSSRMRQVVLPLARHGLAATAARPAAAAFRARAVAACRPLHRRFPRARAAVRVPGRPGGGHRARWLRRGARGGDVQLRSVRHVVGSGGGSHLQELPLELRLLRSQQGATKHATSAASSTARITPASATATAASSAASAARAAWVRRYGPGGGWRLRGAHGGRTQLRLQPRHYDWAALRGTATAVDRRRRAAAATAQSATLAAAALYAAVAAAVPAAHVSGHGQHRAQLRRHDVAVWLLCDDSMIGLNCRGTCNCCDSPPPPTAAAAAATTAVPRVSARDHHSSSALITRLWPMSSACQSSAHLCCDAQDAVPERVLSPVAVQVV